MKKRSIFCILLGLGWMQGCVINDEDAIPLPDTSREVTIRVEIPEAQLPLTRSMDGVKENDVREVDLLLFDVDSSDPDQVTEVFREHACGTIVRHSATGQTYTVEVKAPLTVVAGNRLVVVTNAAAQMASALPALSAGTPKKTVLERLTYASGPWAAGASDETFQPIPMYGESGILTAGSGKRIEGIQLRRMVARIDVVNNAEGFTLERIYLCHYTTVGYIAPAWRAGDGQIMEVSSGLPNLPADPGKQSAAAIYTPVDQHSEGEIYTLESAAADDASESSRRNATCLVLEGMYQGIKSYYRVDFTVGNPTGGLPVRYMPLLRNHKYVVEISTASGRGYDSFEQAVDAYTVPSNLKARILMYDWSVIKEVAFNGQYLLGLSRTSCTLPASATDTPSAACRISVFTNYTPGWEVAAIENEPGGGSVDWLTLSTMSGAGGVITELFLYTVKNEGTSRSASITLKAGRLSQQIFVTQQ